jgi:sodium/potassium/calcium exchanger 2
VCVCLQHASNAATSSQTSVGGGSGAGGSAGSGVTARPVPGGPPTHHHSGTKFRHGLLQLMIHTIDPMHDGKYEHLLHVQGQSNTGSLEHMHCLMKETSAAVMKTESRSLRSGSYLLLPVYETEG